MSVQYTLLPPSISISQREAVRNSYYASYFLDVTVTNPNTVTITNVSATLRVTSEDGTIVVGTRTVTDFGTFTFDITNYPEVSAWQVQLIDAYVEASAVSASVTTISQVTEDVSSVRLRPTSVLPKDALSGDNPLEGIFLKAFCNFPGTGYDNVYGRWEISSDGITWSELTDISQDADYSSIVAADINEQYDPSGNLIQSDISTYTGRTFYLLTGDSNHAYPAVSPQDSLKYRYDCILINPTAVTSSVFGTQIRFRMVTLEYIDETIDNAHYKVKLELGRAIYFTNLGPKIEVLDSDFPSASLGTPVYHNHTLYTYGVKSEQAIVYASETGSLIHPLSRMLDLDSSASDVVTALIPWRDYLIAATEHSLHLIQKADTGFTSKIINPAIGITQTDSRCCVPTLNGILFKSGNRIFQLYPNLYSGEDTVLNISDISKPILHELLDLDTGADTFAFSTEEAYYVFIPGSGHTTCLKYNYTLRVWTKFEYPVVLTDAYVIGVDDIRVFGTHDNCFCEFRIERDLDRYLDELPANFPESARPLLLYGDYVNKTLGELDEDKNGSDGHTPILFIFDSGQKTDRIAYTKQFTEAKVMCVTESQRDSFPCVVQVAVDGELRVHTIQVNTDSPFWKTDSGFRTDDDSDDILLSLNRNIYSDSADILNTMRQLIVRYSGKGHTVRFVLQGNSVCRFRIHSVLSRYRTLNVKQ